MIKYSKEERNNRMMSKDKRALVHNLKGRASRVLSTKAAILREEEKGGLEGLCGAIDALVLSEHESSDLKYFQDEVALAFKFLKDTRKDSIKKRILPVMKEVLKEEWVNE